MIYNVYAIKDALGDFNAPILFRSDAEAVRYFAWLVNDDNAYSKFYRDMNLYNLGKEFDTAEGYFYDNDNDSSVHCISTGVSVWKGFNNED